MSEKHSISNKKRWEKKSPYERSLHMKALVTKKLSKLSPEQLSAHAHVMVKARAKKND